MDKIGYILMGYAKGVVGPVSSGLKIISSLGLVSSTSRNKRGFWTMYMRLCSSSSYLTGIQRTLYSMS